MHGATWRSLTDIMASREQEPWVRGLRMTGSTVRPDVIFSALRALFNHDTTCSLPGEAVEWHTYVVLHNIDRIFKSKPDQQFSSVAGVVLMSFVPSLKFLYSQMSWLLLAIQTSRIFSFSSSPSLHCLFS